MKQAYALLAVSAVLFAPLAPANPPVPAAAAAETCAMPCCHDEAPAADCAPACPCPAARVLPSHTSAVLPAVAVLTGPDACSASPGSIGDETASERTVRPPVPPPRA